MCLRAENVVLPKNGYFGISAATGGLADDHDVYHFLTSSLHLPGELKEGQMPEEAAKLTEEYKQYQEDLDKKKKVYEQEHPDTKKEPELDDWFESDNARELRQIWQSQTHIIEVMRDLSRKMDEMVGRQERTMGLLSSNAQQAAGGVPPAQQINYQPGTAPQLGDTIRRHEVEAIIQNQNQFIQTIRELRTSMVELQSRTDNILQNQARQPTATVQQAGYDVQSMISEMRDGLNQIKNGISSVHTK